MGILDSIRNVFSPPQQTTTKPNTCTNNTVPKSTVSENPTSVKAPNMKSLAIRVSDGPELFNHLQIAGCETPYTIELSCPIRKARIFCHSVLIDNLSDLTIFIITSLYEGRSILEISDLTMMGKTTLGEELQYLFESKLITDMDNPLLTDFGKQYGELLKQFGTLSDGIPVSFNSFADIFEPQEEGVGIDSNERYVLQEQFVRELTRNDNYSNSKEIAVGHINSSMPFSKEIIDSLYTTVRIENRDPEHGYKKLLLNDINKGHSSRGSNCFALAIPVERIGYRAKYQWLDKYRSIIPLMEQLSEYSSDLLSDEANLVLQSINEENESLPIEVYVNMIDGQIYKAGIDLPDSTDDNTVFLLDKRNFVPSLDQKKCKGIYLDEISKKTHYIIKYYSYQQMEVI